MSDRVQKTKIAWWRLALLAGLLLALWVVADRTGARESLTVESIQAIARRSGPLGVAVYLVVFAVALLAQLPGVVFVLAARVAWGPFAGFVAGYVGALAAVSLSFFVVRGVGGSALAQLRWRWAQRVLSHLDERPILTVALLRAVLALSPPLNYALAMSRTRFRDYFVGSALGLIAPISAWILLSDWLMSLLAGKS